MPVASKLGLCPQTVSPRRHISSHEITQSFPIFCLYLFRSDSVIYNYSNQATLDSSALKVYDSLVSQLGESKNKKVQKAAKLNALMFARFAQNMAKVISRVKQKPYTAEDFLRERLKVDVNAVYNEDLAEAAQLMQPMEDRNRVYVRDSNGNVDWGYINNITADNGEIIKAAPLRVQIGFQVGLGSQAQAGVGYTHIAGKHPYIVEKYSSVENAINNILNNYDFVLKEYPNGREQLILGKSIGENKSELLILELCHNDGDYYSVIGIKPQRKKQTKEKKEKALSFNGSATPLSASGDGALYTPTGIKAGTKGDLLARKDNVFPDISITEAGDYVKKYTYVEDDQNNPYWKDFNFNSLMQRQLSAAKGSIGDTVDGQRLIRLFETADQSTFMHEMAHMFLLELQDIAALDPESREAKDLATIVKWAEYKPGQSEEYKGTASEAEFWQREEAIKAAEKRGETVLFLFIKTS